MPVMNSTRVFVEHLPFPSLESPFAFYGKTGEVGRAKRKWPLYEAHFDTHGAVCWVARSGSAGGGHSGLHWLTSPEPG